MDQRSPSSQVSRAQSEPVYGTREHVRASRDVIVTRKPTAAHSKRKHTCVESSCEDSSLLRNKKPRLNNLISHDRHAERQLRLRPSSDAVKTQNRPARRLSIIESLPTEILEVIFLHHLKFSSSGLMSLPRASPLLGMRLSSEHILKEVFNYSCSTPRPKKIHQSSQLATQFYEELREMQSWIVRKPCITMNFVQRLVPEFAVSTIIRELDQQKLSWLGHKIPLVGEEREIAIRKDVHQAIAKINAGPNPRKPTIYERSWIELCAKTEELQTGKLVKLGFSPTQGVITLSVRKTLEFTNYTVVTPEKHLFKDCWHLISFHPGVQIPTRLLRGPWTLSKVELLETLIRSGASVDWVHTTAGETAEQGFYDAIFEDNARAIQALCIFNASEIPSNGIGVKPKQAHLLTAINQSCSTTVFETLLNAPESECDLQDVRVMAALRKMKKRGFREGSKWLYKKKIRDRDLRTSDPTRVSARKVSWWAERMRQASKCLGSGTD